MDTNKTITILEALASGCSPATGELLKEESALQERDVIRALQVAIEQLKLKNDIPQNHSGIVIHKEDIQAAIDLFEELDLSPTGNRLAGFFLASRSFKQDVINAHKLYGKYRNSYQKGQLLDFLTNYLSEHDYLKQGKIKDPWESIDFFRKEMFNNLSDEAIGQLKKRINELGIVKTENLSDYILKARINYPRSHEPWTEEEEALLWEALQETNYLGLLVSCFQRGQNAIERRGQELIYRDQHKKRTA